VGDPGERIVRAAGADKLVVMATHGRSSLARWALGSVVDRVTGSGSAATLLVHPQHA
jgi:nucleotide-binding universal stress UspA family protein